MMKVSNSGKHCSLQAQSCKLQQKMVFSVSRNLEKQPFDFFLSFCNGEKQGLKHS
jgi:hypothetical protein